MCEYISKCTLRHKDLHIQYLVMVNRNKQKLKVRTVACIPY